MLPSLLSLSLTKLFAENELISRSLPALGRLVMTEDTRSVITDYAACATSQCRELSLELGRLRRSRKDAYGCSEMELFEKSGSIRRLLESCFAIHDSPYLLAELRVLSVLKELSHLLLPAYNFSFEVARRMGYPLSERLIMDEYRLLHLTERLVKDKILLVAEHEEAQPLFGGMPLDFPGPLLMSWWQGLSH